MSNRNCSVPGCDRLAVAKALCMRHYSQQWRTGKVLEKPRPHAVAPSPQDELSEIRLALRKAEKVYRLTYNLELRIKRRKEVVELQHLLAQEEAKCRQYALKTCQPMSAL